jgi:membrane fusion protein (multidrug efflux system)
MLSRRHKRAIVGTVAFLLLGALVLFSIGRFFANRALERQLTEERASLRVPEPLVVAVVRDTVERRRNFAARAEPWTRATLAPEVGGTVVRIGGEVGSRMAAGAELLALEDSPARAAAESARIQATEAARRQREVEQLVRTEAMASNDAAVAAATAGATSREAERAAAMLEKYRVRAPFAGIVQARYVDVGDYLNPGQRAFELVDLSQLRLVFYAGETEITSFRPGEKVEVGFPALQGRREQAIVRHVAPATGTNGLFRVEAELANADGAIPGGLAVTITAAIRLYRDMLFIPTAAVRLEGARAVVQRWRKEGAAEPVTIEIGPEVEGRFPVLRGLEEGDRLVVR